MVTAMMLLQRMTDASAMIDAERIGIVMGIFARGTKLWVRFKGLDGKWRNEPTDCVRGDEARAAKLLADLNDEIEKQRLPSLATIGIAAPLTLRAYSQRWIKNRTTQTAKDDESRLSNHILPILGSRPIHALRPRDVQDFVRALSVKKKRGPRLRNAAPSFTNDVIAGRTVRHIYGTLRSMLNDAVAEEIIATNPCVMPKGQKNPLPPKRDKDPTWRRTAVFSAAEVEQIVSAPSIPEDRRVFYALMFLGALRFGEAAALTWNDYEPSHSPLGKLVIEKSYSTHARKVKGTKTENPREMPVHPLLASMLATWRATGFAAFTGRSPTSTDRMVPAIRGAHRNANGSMRRFTDDLKSLGLRPRRQHDARRSFISIARNGGASSELLKWVTHGSNRADIMDVYTTPSWAALCSEVEKASFSPAGTAGVPAPIKSMDTSADGLVTMLVTVDGAASLENVSHKAPAGNHRELVENSDPKRPKGKSFDFPLWRSGRDLNPRPPA